MSSDSSLSKWISLQTMLFVVKHPIATPVVIFAFYKSAYLRTIMIKGAWDIGTTTVRLTGRLTQMVITEAYATHQTAKTAWSVAGAQLTKAESATAALGRQALGAGSSAAIILGSVLAYNIHQFNDNFFEPPRFDGVA
jgi:hypothetical protein